MFEPIFLCADDFGLNPCINQGILKLAEAGRLSATSCMTLAPAFAQDAARLRQSPIAAGLHLSLTEPGASHMPAQALKQVILRSLRRGWKADLLRDEIHRQLDAFEDHMERPPAHIDGHQHIHALPQIREALLDIVQHRYTDHPPVIRSTRFGGAAPTLRDTFKGRVIQSLGAGALHTAASYASLPITHALLGVYNFDADAPTYLRHMTRWMSVARSDDLIMVHPAACVQPQEPLGIQRKIEFDVLFGSAIDNVLKQAQRHIATGMPTMTSHGANLAA